MALRSFILYSFLLATLILNNNVQGQVDQSLFDEAVQLSHNGEWQKSIEKLDSIKNHLKLIGEHKTDNYYYAHVKLIVVYADLGELSRAYDILKEVGPEISSNASTEVKTEFELFHGVVLLRSSKLDEALGHFKTSLEMTGETGQEKLATETLMFLANAYSQKGDYAESLNYAQKALEKVLKIYPKNHFRVGSVYNIIAKNYELQNQAERSLVYWKKSSEIVAYELDSMRLVEMVYHGFDSLTAFYHDIVLWDDSTTFFERVHPADLYSFSNVAYAIAQMGDLPLAEQVYTRVENAARKHNIDYLVFSCQLGRAILYQKLYQYDFAISIYEEALRYSWTQTNSANSQIAWIYHNLALIYGSLDLYDKQQEYNQKALEARLELYDKKHPETAASFLNLGTASISEGKIKESFQFLHNSKSSGYNNLPMLHYLLGMAQDKYGRQDSARFYFNRAVKEANKQNSEYSGFCIALGNFHEKNNNLDSARYYYRLALEANYKEALSIEPLIEEINFNQVKNGYQFLLALYNIGHNSLAEFEINNDLNKLKYSTNVFNTCKQLIFDLRSSFVSEEDNLKFSELVKRLSEQAIKALYLQQKMTGDDSFILEALSFADISKSQILLDAIKTRQMDHTTASNEFTSLSQLKAQIKDREAEIQQLKLSPNTTSLLSEKEKELINIKIHLAELINELKVSQPSLHNYLNHSESDISKSEMEAYLREAESDMLHYFWGEENLYVFRLLKDKPSMFLIETNLDSLTTSIEEFKQMIKAPANNPGSQQANEYVSVGHGIFSLLVEPMIEEMKEDKILIFADGPLANLSFEALPTKKLAGSNLSFSEIPYLLKDKEINYGSSIAVLLSNRGNPEKNRNPTYEAWAPFPDTLSDINYSSIRSTERTELAPLPGTIRELKALSANFSGTEYVGTDASETVFKQSEHSSNIVHIATHAILNDRQPLLSNLLFSQSSTDSLMDNNLYMFEVYALSLKTELAVLTACNTGNGLFAEGEGSVSLARAFMYAGAESVLMSLWLANDVSTGSIMSDFYANLSEGQKKGEALRQAKLQFLSRADNNTAHPFYWSHLVLTGNTQPLVVKTTSWTWVIIAVTAMLLVLFLIQRKSLI